MKRSKWLTLLLVMMLAAMFVVGCPEDDDDDDNNNPTGPTGDLTADEMTDAQIEESLDFGMIPSVEGGMQTAVGSRIAFGGGVFAPDMVEAPSVFLKPLYEISDPPEGWTGPDGDGWYTGPENEFYDTQKVRLTPDIWDNAHADEELTKFEEYTAITYDYQVYSTEIIVSNWAEVNAARTLMNGGWDVTTNTTYGDLDIDYDYEMWAEWTNMSLVEDNYSGHFETFSMYPIVGQDMMPQFVALETIIDLIADGSGDGVGTIGGEEYVHFTFNPVDGYYLTGYYTLKSENYDIQHEFMLYIY